MTNPLDRHRCQLCHQPAGQNARCSCPVDCGDLMCRMAPLPADDGTPRPPLPVFNGTPRRMGAHDGPPPPEGPGVPSTGSGTATEEAVDG